MATIERIPQLQKERPRPRGSRKLLWLVIVFFLALSAVLFFKSSISRISEIKIVGNVYATDTEIEQAAGLRVGDPFFFLDRTAIERRITKLPPVKSARVATRFPGSVIVRVQEYAEAAYEISADGKVSVVLANGSTVKPGSDGISLNRPVLSGWSDQDKTKAQLCQVLAAIPEEKLADISEIRPDPSVSYPDKIKMFTRSRFEVITTVSYLKQKLDVMATIIADKDPGIITLLEADTHKPFSPVNEPTEDESGHTQD
ncbi:MAG TPA: FtsQ-type POTRA domain-containing protein [Bacilli bacterium]